MAYNAQQPQGRPQGFPPSHMPPTQTVIRPTPGFKPNQRVKPLAPAAPAPLLNGRIPKAPAIIGLNGKMIPRVAAPPPGDIVLPAPAPNARRPPPGYGAAPPPPAVHLAPMPPPANIPPNIGPGRQQPQPQPPRMMPHTQQGRAGYPPQQRGPAPPTGAPLGYPLQPQVPQVPQHHPATQQPQSQYPGQQPQSQYPGQQPQFQYPGQQPQSQYPGQQPQVNPQQPNAYASAPAAAAYGAPAAPQFQQPATATPYGAPQPAADPMPAVQQELKQFDEQQAAQPGVDLSYLKGPLMQKMQVAKAQMTAEGKTDWVGWIDGELARLQQAADPMPAVQQELKQFDEQQAMQPGVDLAYLKGPLMQKMQAAKAQMMAEGKTDWVGWIDGELARLQQPATANPYGPQQSTYGAATGNPEQDLPPLVAQLLTEQNAQPGVDFSQRRADLVQRLLAARGTWATQPDKADWLRWVDGELPKLQQQPVQGNPYGPQPSAYGAATGNPEQDLPPLVAQLVNDQNAQPGVDFSQRRAALIQQLQIARATWATQPDKADWLRWVDGELPKLQPTAAAYGAQQTTPYGAQPSNPYGAPPNPYGAPPNPYGAQPSTPYGAQPSNPYGAPPNPYGAQPSKNPQPNAYSQPAPSAQPNPYGRPHEPANPYDPNNQHQVPPQPPGAFPI